MHVKVSRSRSINIIKVSLHLSHKYSWKHLKNTGAISSFQKVLIFRVFSKLVRCKKL
jgi:hypothetical protein